jgi:hypothetical protein
MSQHEFSHPEVAAYVRDVEAEVTRLRARVAEAERLIYQEVAGAVSASESRKQMTEFLQSIG